MSSLLVIYYYVVYYLKIVMQSHTRKRIYANSHHSILTSLPKVDVNQTLSSSSDTGAWQLNEVAEPAIEKVVLITSPDAHIPRYATARVAKPITRLKSLNNGGTMINRKVPVAVVGKS